MQAITFKRIVSRNIGIVTLAAALAVTGAMDVQSAGVSHPPLRVSQAYTAFAQSQESAFTSISIQGEGLVDAVNRYAVQPQLQAYLGIGQGDGLVDRGTVIDFQVMRRSPATASIGLGQGEGFVGPGATVDARILNASPLKAFPGIYQGEGLADVFNRTASKQILAYTGVHQGEGLIGPGGGN